MARDFLKIFVDAKSAWFTGVILLSSCVETSDVSKLFDVSFDGIRSAEITGDGNYVIQWDQGHDPTVIYAVYQTNLTNGERFGKHVTLEPDLAPAETPLVSGSIVSSVKGANSYTVLAGSLTEGQAYGFSVVVDSNKRTFGSARSIVIKVPLEAQLKVNDGQQQKIALSMTSKNLTASLTTFSQKPVSGELVTFELSQGAPLGTRLTKTSVKTDAKGHASTQIVAGETSGFVEVIARWGQESSVNWSLQIVESAEDAEETIQTKSVDQRLITPVAGDAQVAEVEQTFASPLTVKIQQKDQLAIGESVEFKQLTGPAVTLLTPQTTSSATGLASTFVVAGKESGIATIKATWRKVSTTFLLTVGSGASLTINGGQNQIVTVSSAVAIPLQVRAQRMGLPSVGEKVAFSQVSGPPGTLSHPSSVIDAGGIAQTSFAPDSMATGEVILKARWREQEVLFKLTVVDDAIDFVSGNPQIGDPLQAFGLPLKVRVTRDGQPLPFQSVTFSLLSGSVAVSLSNNLVKTDANGFAAVTAFAGLVQGGAKVRASWNFKSVDFDLTVALDERMTIVGGQQQIAAPGQIFADPLKVQVIKNGLPVTGATVNFTLVSGPSVTLSSPSALTDATGIAQMTLTAGSSSGLTVVRATWHQESVTFNLTIMNQSQAGITAISGNNQSEWVGESLTQPLVVETRDLNTGNPIQHVLVRFAVTSGNGKINGNLQTIDLSSDPSGRVSVNFKLGTLAGAQAVRASVVGNPSSFVDFTATGDVNPQTAVHGPASTIVSSVASLQANGVSQATLTLTTRDLYGNRIPKTTGHVVFTASGGTLLGTPIKHNDGTWTQVLQAPTSSAGGSLVITATYEGIAIGSSPLPVGLISGSVDPSQSTISPASASVIADGTSTTLITVTLKDALGNNLSTGGETVAIFASAGTMIGTGVIDHQNGSYSRYFRAPTLAQTVQLNATVGGVPIGGTASLTLTAGPYSLAKTALVISPSTLVPNGSSLSAVTVVLKDAFGNQLSQSSANVLLSSNLGTWQAPIVNNNDGTFTRFLVASTTPGTAQITATIDGQAVPGSVYVYMTNGESGPNVQRSVVEATSAVYVPADGSSTLTIRVILKDSAGQNISGGGSQISFATTAGTFIGPVVDSGNGTYTRLLRAPPSAAVATVTASFDGQTILDNEIVRFYGAFSPATSTLAVIPNAVQADGTSMTTVTLQAKDSVGNAIPTGGSLADLAFATTAGTLVGTLEDNGNGTYSQSLRAPSTSGSATVSATFGGTALTSTAGVNFFPSTSLGSMTIDCSNIGTYKNTNIMIDAVTVTMNSHGNAAGSPCTNEFVFTSVTLRNGGTITHSASSSTVEYGLEFTAGTLTIADPASKIDVSGKGYVPTGSTNFRVAGNTIVNSKVGSASTLVGGTHGGEGGSTTSTNHPSKVYGSLYQPFTLGGSASTNNTNIGTAGGGRVKMTIGSSGSLVNNGTIAAKGTDGTTNNGAGAGGSIWISTPTLKGTGTISADGGGSINPGSGGGGGRIAVYYTSALENFALPTEITTNVTACGGLSTLAGADGAAGTIFLKKNTQTYGDLVVNNCNRNTSINSATTVIDAPAPALPDSVTATTLTKAGGFGDNYGTLSPFAGWFLNADTTQNATASLIDDVWFPVTAATLNTVTISGGSVSASNPTGTKNFRLGLVFDNLEIMGRAQVTGSAPILVMSGDLRSGDSGTLAIAGTSPPGLEIANVSAVTIDAASTTTTSSLAALSQRPVHLKLVGGTYSQDSINVAALTLDGATLTTGCTRTTVCINLTGALRLTGNAQLIQKTSTVSAENSLEIIAASLTLDGGSTISAVGRGYQPATTTAQSRTLGNLEQYNIAGTTGTGLFWGGSHGGRGAAGGSSNTDQFATYGNLFDPYFSGASGAYGGSSGYQSLPGGGIIRIQVGSGALTINGTIDASAGSTCTAATGCAGGAGGSIYLSGGELSGNGNVVANGTTAPNQGWRAGGGGRIAVYYSSKSGGFADVQIKSRIRAHGGLGNGSNIHGGAGTVYLKSTGQTYGDLLISNANSSHAYASTPIAAPALSTSTTLTGTSLTKSNAFNDAYGMMTGHLTGYYLNPNTAQNGTVWAADDTLFRITAQTASSLTTSGGTMTSVGASGNTFQVVLVLDSFEVSGRALVDLGTEVIVHAGDISSADDTTAFYSGATTSWGMGNIEFKNRPDVTLTNGSYFLWDGFQAGSLTLDASTTLTVGCLRTVTCLDLTGALTLTNSSSLVQRATTPATEYSLEVSMGSLSVDGSSVISASGRGYTSPLTTGQSRTLGNAERANIANTGALNCGGSHGGRCGGSMPYATYGSFVNPYHSGASGGISSGITSFSGGGIIRLSASGSAVVQGTIESDGTGGGNSASAGAGGSIFLSVGSLSGNGTIRANGGSVPGNSNSWPGGGGRIAVAYTSLGGNFTRANALSGYKALGGRCTNPASTHHAGPGTVYLKAADQTYGDLLVNNDGTNGAITPILFPPPGEPTLLTSTILTKNSAFADSYGIDTGYLVGYSLIPNRAQNGTPSVLDDTTFLITSQSAHTLGITGGDMTTVAPPGNTFTYELALILDNFQISGRANVDAGGRVFVREGDLTSNDQTTAIYSGQFSDSSGQLSPLEFAPSHNITLSNGSYNLTHGLSGSSLTLSSAQVTMGCIRGSVCLNLTGALTLTGSNLYQAATTTTTEYSIEAVLGSLTMDGTSTIDASGRGYLPANSSSGGATTVGNQSITPGCTASGGAHGGRGGAIGTTICSAYAPYDSITHPAYSGGSGLYAGNAASAGGGVIRLDTGASGSMNLNGTIAANGATCGVNYCGAGAGGTVYLRTGSISGSGSISVNGGASPFGSTGAGGRAALHYSSSSGGFSYPLSMVDRFQAFGGIQTGTNSASVSGVGANGTIFLKSSSQNFGDLAIDGNNPSSNVHSNAYAVITAPTGLASTGLTATTLTRGGSFVDATNTMTKHLVGYQLSPNRDQNATPTLTDDTLYPIIDQTAHTLVTGGNLTATGVSGQNFAVVLVLDNLQVRRGGRLETEIPILVKNGDLLSNDTGSAVVSGMLRETGAGFLEWQGASDVTVNYSSAAGVTVGTVTAPGNLIINANGGTYSASSITAGGTLTLQSGTFAANSATSSSHMTLQSGTFNINKLTSGGDLGISASTVNSGSTDFSPTVAVAGSMNLSTSTLKSLETNTTTEYRLYVHAGHLTIQNGSTISADGTGYPGPTSFNFVRTLGNVALGTFAQIGGSHGGRGGRYSGSAMDPYGNFRQPVTLGSSGRGWDSNMGAHGPGDGGGSIRLVVPGVLTHSGVVTANGAAPWGAGGGGAGGSIWVTAGTLTGSGSMRAHGGTNSTNGSGQGGGGGRIAVEYGSLGGSYTLANTGTYFTAFGGTSSTSTYSGAAGTVFTKSSSQIYGNLLINNNNQTTESTYAYTTIALPTASQSGALTETTLSASGAFGNNIGTALNQLVGFHLNPRINQNGTTTLMDDTFFEITANDSSTLTTSGGDMTIAPVEAASGQTFRLVLDLDNFEVAGLARADFTGVQIRVREGDLSSNNTTTFSLNGQLKAHTVDVGSGVSWNASGSSSETITRKCSSTNAC